MSLSTHKNHWILVTLILWAVFALCVETFRQDSLWADETWSLWAVQPPGFVEMLARVRQDFHPPLYFIALDGWVTVAGDSVLAIRSLSTFLGLLAAAGIYTIGKWLFDRETGLIAVVLLGCSSFYRYYAGETRMYSLLLLLSLLCMFQYVRWLRRPSLSRSVVYGILLASTLYTHYYGGWIAAAQGLHLLLFRRDRLAAWLWPIGLAVMLFLPWTPVLASQISQRPASLVAAAALADASTAGWVLSVMTGGLGLTILLPYLLTPDLRWLRQRAASLALILFWIVVPPGLILLLNAWGVALLYLPRYFMGVLPAGVLLVAWGVRSALWRFPSIILLIVMLAAQIATYRQFWPSRSAVYEQVFRDFAERYTTNDALVIDVDPSNLISYHDRHSDLGLREHATIDLTGREYVPATINPLLASLPRNAPIWLVLPFNVTRTWHIFSSLDETVYASYGGSAANMVFYRFEPGDEADLAYRFGGYVGLVETGRQQFLTVKVGAPVCIEIALEVLHPLDGRYSVGAHIVDNTNHSLAQWDEGLGIRQASDEYRRAPCFVGSDSIPAGEYAIQVSVYEWQTLVRLPVLEVSTGRDVYWGDTLIFAYLHVLE